MKDKIFFIGANNPETMRMMKALENRFTYLGFIDNDPEKKDTQFCGLQIWGGYDSLHKMEPDCKAVNLITRDTNTRLETSIQVAKRGFKFANFIHPSIDVTDIEIGTGNYLQERVILQAGCKMGHNSSIHMASLIGHESTIGNSVFIAHGVTMSGLVTVEDGVFIGAGAVIVPRVKIGAWSTIGAGAVVTKDVPAGSVVVGNPARVIKQKDNLLNTGRPWNE